MLPVIRCLIYRNLPLFPQQFLSLCFILFRPSSECDTSAAYFVDAEGDEEVEGEAVCSGEAVPEAAGAGVSSVMI